MRGGPDVRAREPGRPRPRGRGGRDRARGEPLPVADRDWNRAADGLIDERPGPGLAPMPPRPRPDPALPDNLGHLFDAPLHLTPDAPAVFQGDTVLSFAELDARVNRMANALTGSAVRAGDRVALMFSNDLRFLEALFGRRCGSGRWRCRSTRAWATSALRYVVEDAEAGGGRRQWSHGRARARVAGALPGVRHLLVDGVPPLGDNAVAYEPLLAAASPTRVAPPDRPGRRSACSPTRRARRASRRASSSPHGGQMWNADILRKAHPVRRTPSGARGRAALPQERDGRRGQAVPARRRLARHPPGLRRAWR